MHFSLDRKGGLKTAWYGATTGGEGIRSQSIDAEHTIIAQFKMESMCLGGIALRGGDSSHMQVPRLNTARSAKVSDDHTVQTEKPRIARRRESSHT